MMKLEESSSFASQSDIYQSPMHSEWLQSNLNELDGKLKAMLKLIKADDDSFDQQAEIYYEKRPELVNMVDEFDRAYRHLATRYDHLIGAINKNIPISLQIQYGLMCDSPRGSTFTGDQEGFEKHLKNFEVGQLNELSQPEELEIQDASVSVTRDNEHLEEQTLSSSDSEMDGSTEFDKLQQISYNLEQENQRLMSHCHTIEEEKEALQIRVKELEVHISALQEETCKLAHECLTSTEQGTVSENKIKALEEELLRLQEENARLIEETLRTSVHVKRVEEEVSALQNVKVVLEEEIVQDKNKVDRLQAVIESLQAEGTTYKAIALDRADQVRNLENNIKQQQEENDSLAAEALAAVEHGKVAITALRFLKGEVCSFMQRNKKLRDEILDKTADGALKVREILNLQVENRSLTNKLQEFHAGEAQKVSELNWKVKELHGQLTFLGEENKKQKLVLIDRAEEKREAIRQLCFSIDVLKEKNQRLEEALCTAKMHLNGFRNSSSSHHLSTWKKFFLGSWKVSTPQPYALAL